MSEQDYEQLTLFRADSPASRFPWQESKKEKGMIVTYGLRCSELSESCARIALSVRTYLESSGLPPGKWSRIGSKQGITSSCSVLKLRLSELGTGEQGCFLLLPTPNTMDKMPPKSEEALNREAKGTRKGRRQPCNLRDWVAVQEGFRMWPTPTALDPAKERMKTTQQAGNSRHSLDLPRAVRLWPTPRANEGKGVLQSVPPSRQKEPGKRNLTQAVAMRLLTTPCAADATGTTGGANHRSLRTDVNGQLNPTWVEWLMGFPIGWTDLNASETR